MTFPKALAVAGLLTLAAAWTWRAAPAEAADAGPSSLEASYDEVAGPFLAQSCLPCHNADNPTSGINVSQLNGALEERHIRLWGAVKRKLVDRTMPPEGFPQPNDADREKMLAWVTQALDVARSRPRPKNGLVRRLTVAQYGNALSELLHLEDDLTDILPPDAVSKDGFVNNTSTLELSPLLMEAYLEIAAAALDLAIVDPDEKPSIQNFRMDLGAGINPTPLPEPLILGAQSMLIPDSDYTITQLTPEKPFPVEPYRMRTKYRFIEGYKGNATVRGWREFDSIYHAVFADVRGSKGYPKGEPWSTVPSGLLLRPAIPTDEIFGSDGTYGPKANFKISLRELPDHGRFRVTVTAAKYDDALLLDPGVPVRKDDAGLVVDASDDQVRNVRIAEAGVYQVDIHESTEGPEIVPPDASRLEENLIAHFPLDGELDGELTDQATWVDSPFGQALAVDGTGDSAIVPHDDSMMVGDGEFTVAAWIKPRALRNAGVVAFDVPEWPHGWRLETTGGARGIFQIATFDSDNESNGAVQSQEGAVQAGEWQHLSAVVRRGGENTVLYLNGFPVGKGEIGYADLSNPKANLNIGRVPGGNYFQGEIDDVRVYSRALGEAEIQALVEPGREFAVPPAYRPQDVTLFLGDRRFDGKLVEPGFLAVRLDAGPLDVRVEHAGTRPLDHMVLTPLAADDPVAEDFLAFERRAPRVGVHVGLRRDCGSTFDPAGPPQPVRSGDFQKYVFEGAISNYASPDVEKDNVNYLAGIREIAVHSEYTDGRDMPRLLIRSIEFEGPLYEHWPPKTHQAIFIDSDRKHDAQAYARQIISGFVERAYRRPPTGEEVDALTAVFNDSLAGGASFQQSIKDALTVALTSPQFLFLVETSQTPDPEPLNDEELASKLSFFLWNSPPDATTKKLAAEGALRENLDQEIDRMVEDERFARFAREFTSQWLSLEKLDVLEPDRKKFPKLTREARAQLRREPIESVQYLVRENLPVERLIRSDFILANEVTADYYGLGDKVESGFDFVPIVHGRPELGGILAQAGLMAGLSDGRESNPVKRGAWVARKIVAEPPADPPPNVPDLEADTEGLSLRERLEQHRSVPGCMQCHTKIDPWGVALEEFDAGGRLKPEPADAGSTLPDGTEVEGVNDLKRYLAEDRIDQVAFSVAKHLAIYANGRDLTYNELTWLRDDLPAKLRDENYPMRDLVRYVVKSKLFLEK